LVQPQHSEQLQGGCCGPVGAAAARGQLQHSLPPPTADEVAAYARYLGMDPVQVRVCLGTAVRRAPRGCVPVINPPAHNTRLARATGRDAAAYR
jgi:hypothetical protein